MTEPSLYVGTYGKYNDGSIAGKWLNLTDYADADEFLAACYDLHKDEADAELMFQDFEGFPRELYAEAMSKHDIELLYSYVNLDEDDRERVDEYLDATGNSYDEDTAEQSEEALFTVLEKSKHEWDEEMGWYVVDNGLFGVEIPEGLQNYIDYEALGREWLYDMNVSDNGWVFRNW